MFEYDLMLISLHTYSWGYERTSEIPYRGCRGHTGYTQEPQIHEIRKPKSGETAW